IVLAITGIARSLGYSVVAEKIETQETLDMLAEMGVDFAQGFLLHKPEPIGDIIDRCSRRAKIA
ncbi:MAG: EAL domain-containing protein, partial [Mesorhizobium sp.]|nr:EAL domain-containing protein [Mesorhizobium sp.]